jgi:hypothetical protein
VLPLPRISAAQLHVTQSHARYARGLAPFIVTGITDHPAWAERERSAGMRLSHGTALAARLPRYAGRLLPPHNMEASNAQPLWVAFPTAPSRPLDHAPRASTARCLRWNMGAGAWRPVARLLGPLPLLFTSDEPWLDVLRGGESLRAACFRTTHWRMLRVGAREAGTFDRVDAPHASSWQVRGGGGGGAVWLAAHATSPPRLPIRTHTQTTAGLSDTEWWHVCARIAGRPCVRHA